MKQTFLASLVLVFAVSAQAQDYLGQYQPQYQNQRNYRSYDNMGVPNGRAERDQFGNYRFYDNMGVPNGRAERQFNGDYRFYDRMGVPSGRIEGQ